MISNEPKSKSRDNRRKNLRYSIYICIYVTCHFNIFINVSQQINETKCCTYFDVIKGMFPFAGFKSRAFQTKQSVTKSEKVYAKLTCSSQ